MYSLTLDTQYGGLHLLHIRSTAHHGTANEIYTRTRATLSWFWDY